MPTAVETAASLPLPPFLSRLSFLPLLPFCSSAALSVSWLQSPTPAEFAFRRRRQVAFRTTNTALLLAVFNTPGGGEPEHSRLHHLLEFAVARTSSDVASALKDSVDSPDRSPPTRFVKTRSRLTRPPASRYRRKPRPRGRCHHPRRRASSHPRWWQLDDARRPRRLEVIRADIDPDFAPDAAASSSFAVCSLAAVTCFLRNATLLLLCCFLETVVVVALSRRPSQAVGPLGGCCCCPPIGAASSCFVYILCVKVSSEQQQQHFVTIKNLRRIKRKRKSRERKSTNEGIPLAGTTGKERERNEKSDLLFPRG